MSTVSISLPHIHWSSNNSNKTSKGDQGDSDWKESSKTFSICRWYDSVQTLPQKLYQRTNTADKWLQECGRLQGQLKKSIDLLDTNSKEAEKEIVETSSITIAMKYKIYISWG